MRSLRGVIRFPWTWRSAVGLDPARQRRILRQGNPSKIHDYESTSPDGCCFSPIENAQARLKVTVGTPAPPSQHHRFYDPCTRARLGEADQWRQIQGHGLVFSYQQRISHSPYFGEAVRTLTLPRSGPVSSIYHRIELWRMLWDIVVSTPRNMSSCRKLRNLAYSRMSLS